MVGTILPVVYGRQRIKRIPWLLVFYSAASVLGAGLLGSGLGFLGILMWRSSLTSFGEVLPLLGFGTLVFGAAQLKIIPLKFPQRKKQVPHGWRCHRPTRMVISYGAVLGLGFATRIPVITIYAVGLFCFMRRDLLMAALVFALFGVGRSLPLWFLHKTLRACGFRSLCRQLALWQEAIGTINGFALALCGFLTIALSLFFSA
jgi:hypothetical protein